MPHVRKGRTARIIRQKAAIKRLEEDIRRSQNYLMSLTSEGREMSSVRDRIQVDTARLENMKKRIGIRS